MSKPHLRYKKQTPRERTWTIHFIALEKTVKGTVLIVVAFKLLSLFGSDVHAWAEDFVTRHGIDLANRYVHAGLERLVGIGNKQLVEFSIVALVYAAMLYVEGIGLWLQKRWAEYLTTVATAIFIPFEIYELYERFTWVRIAILLLNIFVVWYLATRLKDEKKEVLATEGPESDEANPTQVKICGITNLEDAILSVRFGADALGFNFYDKSPRYISPEMARSIIAQLPKDISKVGVFVNEAVEKICEAIQIAGLDAIQLHGDENAEFVDALRLRSGLNVIKALRVTPSFRPEDAAGYGADAILLDGYSAKERGGTGDKFNWEVAGQVNILVPCLYLAGGLTPENVAEAISVVRPYAVDVCSRLESQPGKKDMDKLERFITAVKETR